MRTGIRRAVVIVLAAATGLLAQTLLPAAAAHASQAPVSVFFSKNIVQHGQLGGTIALDAYVEDVSTFCRNAPFSCDTPSGNVEFSLSGSGGSQPLATPHLVPVGGSGHHAYAEAKVSAAVTVPAGSYTLQVHYSGDGTFNPNHATIAFTVTKASVTLSLHQNSTSSGKGDAVTFTAALPAPKGSEPKEYGTVTFYDNGHLLYTSPVAGPVVYPEAALSTTKLATGDNAITASYSGDKNYGAADAPAIHHTVHYSINPCVLVDCSKSAPPVSSSSGGEGNGAGDSGIGTQGPSATGASGGSDDGGGGGAGGGGGGVGGVAPGAGAGAGPVGTGGSGPATDPATGVSASASVAATAAAATASTGHGSNGKLWWIIVIVVLVLAGLAALLWFLLGERRRPPDGEPAA